MNHKTNKNKLIYIIILLKTLIAPTYPQTELDIIKKQHEIKQNSLPNKIINSIEIKIIANLGAGNILSQYDPINPTYQPYTIRDRIAIIISINISKILDNSTLKIKQIELTQLQNKLQQEIITTQIKNKIIQEKINLLKEKIQTQQQILQLFQAYFNQNKIQYEKLLEEKIKLTELQFQLKQLELELNQN